MNFNYNIEKLNLQCWALFKLHNMLEILSVKTILIILIINQYNKISAGYLLYY